MMGATGDPRTHRRLSVSAAFIPERCASSSSRQGVPAAIDRAAIQRRLRWVRSATRARRMRRHRAAAPERRRFAWPMVAKRSLPAPHQPVLPAPRMMVKAPLESSRIPWGDPVATTWSTFIEPLEPEFRKKTPLPGSEMLALLMETALIAF